MDLVESFFSRRDFLKWMGKGYLGASSLALLGQGRAFSMSKSPSPALAHLQATSQDALSLCEGVEMQILAQFGDRFFSNGDTFGACNDFTAFLPTTAKKDEGFLWINHETPEPTVLVSGWEPGKPKTHHQILKEQHAVGGSLLEIKQDPQTHQWRVNAKSKANRRFSALTPIGFSHGPIAGEEKAMGTLANCSGGVTPWGTFLTCEENYDGFYGEVSFHPQREWKAGDYQWHLKDKQAPELYGWVVEINPLTGKAQKLNALGRMAHEGACVTQSADKRCVVYMGDDADDRCLYKFIADSPGQLHTGTLYVASLEQGQWIALTLNHPKLKGYFKSQLEIWIRTREAVQRVGATPLHRPEGIAIHPQDQSVVVALTNHKSSNDYYGSLLRLVEKDNNPLSLEFKSSTLLTGGKQSDFACPDNVCFDAQGNLWFTTDISSHKLNKAPYKDYKNNSLFVVPARGKSKGQAMRVASAPCEAELTGPSFSSDGKTLFLSVQHPGECSEHQQWTSHWPGGKKNQAAPKSSVVTLRGPAIWQPELLV